MQIRCFIAYSQERYSEAEPLLLEAIEIRDRRLGSNHHLTVTTRTQLEIVRTKLEIFRTNLQLLRLRANLSNNDENSI